MKIRMLAASGVLLTASGLAVSACGSSAPANPSAACKTAVSNQDAYVGWVLNYTSYPDDDVSEGMAIQQHDIGLINAVQKAGCPPSTKVDVLPGE